jgi:hypothetical protein
MPEIGPVLHPHDPMTTRCGTTEWVAGEAWPAHARD